MKRILLIVPLLFFAMSVEADERMWTYRECVDYAFEHNLTLRGKQLERASSEANLEQSNAEWLPSLSFSTSQGFVNYAHPNENTDRNAYSGSYGLNAGWTLFNGFKRRNQIEADKLQVEISQLGIDDYRYTIQTEILSKYIDILYAKESIDIAEKSLEVSAYQLERAKALVASGKMSRVDCAQIESQYKTDCYNLTAARASHSSAIVALKNLLELGIDDSFDVATIDVSTDIAEVDIPTKTAVFADACTWMPSLKKYNLEQQLSDYNIKVARGGYYPTVTLNAGVNTANNTGAGNLGSQLIDRLNEQISLNISVPIFDNKKNKTAVALAEIDKLNAELDYENAVKTISQNIENVHIDAVSAKAKYEAGVAQVSSAELADELVNEQFKIGLINTLDLMNSHNTLLQARLSLLQAKYTAIFNFKMLQYYQTSQITL
ncbi:MAG: TolC family protein [Candidatus Limisoma sp.]